MLSEELEKLEKKYFESIYYVLRANKTHIEARLKSGLYVKGDWVRILKKKSEIDVGAEHVIDAILARAIQWSVSSIPVGSNLCFEVGDEAILHLDCKTVKYGDEFKDDRPGTFLVGESQASYEGYYVYNGESIPFIPKLPKYYKHDKLGEIPCLTYFVKLVYDRETFDMRSLNLYCLPNGQLTYYRNLIKGVKVYNKPKTRCITVRIDSKAMVNISKQKAGWERAVEEF